MFKVVSQTLATVGLCMAAALTSVAGDISPGLSSLQGKWSVTKTNREGQRYSQMIEIKNDQLTFQIIGDDNRVRLFAKGTVKAGKSGVFGVLTLSNIQGGRSVDELEPVDDTRAMVYTLRDGQLFLGSNFDKERSNEKPTVETYLRTEAAKESVGASDDGAAKVLGTWKLELTMGDNKLDYGLRIGRSNGKLEATQVSPRSGEHKCKSVVFKDGELVIEVERDIDGNQVSFIYKGKLSGDGLSGSMVVKGNEDQFNGTWKASK